jgi:hypothetical protein
MLNPLKFMIILILALAVILMAGRAEQLFLLPMMELTGFVIIGIILFRKFLNRKSIFLLLLMMAMEL